MFRLITPLKAAARAAPRHAYSTSSKPAGGTSAYVYFGDKLGGASTATKAAPAVAARKEPPTSSALNPKEFVDFKLKNVQKLTHNTSRFTFELQQGQNLGLDVASCVVTKFVGEDGKPVIRPYTPTSDADLTGSFDFVIKRYEGGPMSSHIHNLKPGESLSVKGPISKYPLKTNQHDSVSLIAGGSGITPMIQVIGAILQDKADKTKVHLIYANVSPQDIILKDELDAYAKAHPDQFKVTYVIDKPAEGWTGPTGYVTAELIKKAIPDIGKGNTKVMVCGPPPMMKTVSGSKGPNFTQGDVDGALKELGLTNDLVFKF
ncbi:hypothetical protein B0O80DRAFT_206679 [Mortierella sp. GBAus27b]|nr:hypothetical protein B0O80DRAFT_206679 [Mortierella sp. GBAus27b]